MLPARTHLPMRQPRTVTNHALTSLIINISEDYSHSRKLMKPYYSVPLVPVPVFKTWMLNSKQIKYDVLHHNVFVILWKDIWHPSRDSECFCDVMSVYLHTRPFYWYFLACE